MAKQKFRHGDIFAIKTGTGSYLFGRVLLDVKRQCLGQKLIDPANPLTCFGGGILIEIRREISGEPRPAASLILLPGIFVTPFMLEDGIWEIVGHEPVDPAGVDFPETILIRNNQSVFIKGEIAVGLGKPSSYAEKVGVLPGINACGQAEDIALFYLNDPGSTTGPLSDSDLRYNRHRPEVYRLIRENPDQTYFEMSGKRALDLGRFY